MRICGIAANILHGERELPDTFPRESLNDYWITKQRDMYHTSRDFPLVCASYAQQSGAVLVGEPTGSFQMDNSHGMSPFSTSMTDRPPSAGPFGRQQTRYSDEQPLSFPVPVWQCQLPSDDNNRMVPDFPMPIRTPSPPWHFGQAPVHPAPTTPGYPAPTTPGWTPFLVPSPTFGQPPSPFGHIPPSPFGHIPPSPSEQPLSLSGQPPPPSGQVPPSPKAGGGLLKRAKTKIQKCMYLFSFFSLVFWKRHRWAGRPRSAPFAGSCKFSLCLAL